MNSELYTSNLVERVYYGERQHDETKIKEQIKEFILELYERRREEPIEGGLQASMIIMPEAFAAKVNENDGLDYHKITEINLLRHIKKEDKFYKNEAAGEFGLLFNESKEIIQDGVELRILDGKNEIMIAIVANNNIKSDFQLSTLKTIIDNIRNLQRSRAYTHVKVGLHTPITKVEFGDIKEEKYNDLLKALEIEMSKLDQKDEFEK